MRKDPDVMFLSSLYAACVLLQYEMLAGGGLNGFEAYDVISEWLDPCIRQQVKKYADRLDLKVVGQYEHERYRSLFRLHYMQMFPLHIGST